jgi:DNA-binding XRE family transcriptional regulator
MDKTGGVIYAIGAIDVPWIKIGSTTRNVENRLKELQTGQPFPLHVIAKIVVEADVRRVEKQIHAFLASERHRGEWFAFPMDSMTLERLIVRAVQYIADEDAREPQLTEEKIRSLYPNSINTRIRQARLAYGMSQAELARRVGISKTAMNDIEQDRTTDPGFSVVARIAGVLGLSVEYFSHAGMEGGDAVPQRRAPAESRGD